MSAPKLARECKETLEEARHMMLALADGIHEHPHTESAPVFQKIDKTLKRLDHYLYQCRQGWRFEKMEQQKNEQR